MCFHAAVGREGAGVTIDLFRLPQRYRAMTARHFQEGNEYQMVSRPSL